MRAIFISIATLAAFNGTMPAFAEDATVKTYSATRDADAKQEMTILVRRKSLQDKFQAKKDEILSDVQMVNLATQKAIAEARGKALQKAMQRCFRHYTQCRELGMKVNETENSDVDTDMKQMDNGLTLQINKEVRAEAQVTIEVIGGNGVELVETSKADLAAITE